MPQSGFYRGKIENFLVTSPIALFFIFPRALGCTIGVMPLFVVTTIERRIPASGPRGFSPSRAAIISREIARQQPAASAICFPGKEARSGEANAWHVTDTGAEIKEVQFFVPETG